MPINVFGNSSSSHDNRNEIDSSIFVQKLYLRTKFIESIEGEDIDLKNQFRIKNLPDPISIREAASITYVDNKFNDPSVIKNTTHVDFNDKNVTTVGFIEVSQGPQFGGYLTPKLYVDNTIRNNVDESSFLR